MNIDTSQVERNLKRLAAATPAAIDRLLGKVAMAVLADAKDRTPYDTGALRAANAARWHGGEQPPEPAAESPEPFAASPKPGEAIIYNGMSYAAAVHEDLEAQHDHGEAKFLERALLSVGRERTIRELADNLLREMGRGRWP